MKSTKSFSIIIPLYNEEKFVEKQIDNLIKSVSIKYNSYEILLIENGSTDNTYEIIKKLTKIYPKLIRALKLNTPCYGLAVKTGIEKAEFNRIVQFDIDFIDINFLNKSQKLLLNFDIIIGSKNHPLSNDQRPVLRVFMTKLINLFVRNLLKYKGTDTHGIKAYKRNKISQIIKKVKTTHHFFETELILRAAKDNFKIIELPVHIKELRPTRFPTLIRLIEALKEVVLLIKLRKELVR